MLNTSRTTFFRHVSETRLKYHECHLNTTTSACELVNNERVVDLLFACRANGMQQKLLFEPGKSWTYSNTSYSLLTLIIERVSGLSYEDYLYKYLFKPANMTHTGYSRPQFLSNNVAVQHTDGKSNGKPTQKPWDGGQPYLHLKGNGGILSTTEDLYKWHIALLTDKILSSKVNPKLGISLIIIKLAIVKNEA